jgi:DNA helicase-2/ATP-dependent DNA helicase PcrA
MLVYTPDQQNAIAHRAGNLLILACAGSGKTEVISARIAELVREKVPKRSIIAFTFTERAAGELKARIRRHLEEKVPEDPSLGDMYVGTIHSFCLQLLKEIDPSYRKYEVMDEARQAALIMTNFRLNPENGRGIGLDRLRSRTRSGGYWDTVRMFVTTLNVIHQKGIAPDKHTSDEVREAVRRYENIAYGSPNYFFDFDKIIGELVNKLRANPAHLAEVRRRFQYLVVDEYQDVDDRQEELIGLMSDCGNAMHVTAVGDDDQAIYGWRGAQITNILTFRTRYPNVHTVTLDWNFRSTHAIVDIANAAIRVLPPDRRTAKSMEARHWDGPENPTGFSETLSERSDIQLRTFADEKEEANWIAERVRDLRGTLIKEKDGTQRAIDYADMAVLLRSVRSNGQAIAAALREATIPVVVKGIGGLFEHEEVQLLQAAFCLLARSPFYFEDEDGYAPRDEVFTRDFVRKRITKLRYIAAMPNAEPARFLEWIAAEREKLDRRNLEKHERGRLARRIYPQDLFQQMLKVLGAANGPAPWPAEVLYNLGRVSQLITQFEAVHQWITPNQLTSLCMFFGGWAARLVDEGGVDEVAAPNAVQIMTVHAAKGLEWPVVFLPRVSSSNFPSSRRNQGPETFLDATVFNPAAYASGDDGERRLWYVGLTRCRKFLHVSSPDRSRKKPTKYLTSIEHEYVQRSGDIPLRPKGDPTPPADVELLPTTYTDLSYFWRCPFEYQLRALMGFGPGVKESYGYGQQIHNILAEVHQNAKDGKLLTREEVKALADLRFHLRYTRDGDTWKPFSALRDAAKRSLDRYLESFPDASRFVLDSEKPFEFIEHESGALISGTIDLLQRVDSSGDEPRLTPVAVIDFKAHKFKDIEDYRRNRAVVEDQLTLYAVAARSALGFDAQRAQAHFLSPKPVPENLRAEGVQESFDVDISESRRQEVIEKVAKAVTGIRTSLEQRRFELRGPETKHCPNCDYREMCPGLRRWDARDRTSPRPPSPEEERAVELRQIMEDVDAGPTPQ